MDDGLDMDDLFGEEPVMSFAPAPPAKGLVQRVEEMRLGGCCTCVYRDTTNLENVRFNN